MKESENFVDGWNGDETNSFALSIVMRVPDGVLLVQKSFIKQFFVTGEIGVSMMSSSIAMNEMSSTLSELI
mgnify:CR=1 FL=1